MFQVGFSDREKSPYVRHTHHSQKRSRSTAPHKLIPFFRDWLSFDRSCLQSSSVWVSETENIQTNDYLDKARVLVLSVIVAVVVNVGIVVLLSSIIISRPQNPAPLFSVNPPPPSLIGPLPRPTIPDHSKVPLIISYSITLHATFSPFPTPPNPGKLKHPLDHEHFNSSSCFICITPWSQGIGY